MKRLNYARLKRALKRNNAVGVWYGNYSMWGQPDEIIYPANTAKLTFRELRDMCLRFDMRIIN